MEAAPAGMRAAMEGRLRAHSAPFQTAAVVYGRREGEAREVSQPRQSSAPDKRRDGPGERSTDPVSTAEMTVSGLAWQFPQTNDAPKSAHRNNERTERVQRTAEGALHL